MEDEPPPMVERWMWARLDSNQGPRNYELPKAQIQLDKAGASACAAARTRSTVGLKGLMKLGGETPLFVDRVPLGRDRVPNVEERLAVLVPRFLVAGARAASAVEGVERMAVVGDLRHAVGALRRSEERPLHARPGLRRARRRERWPCGWAARIEGCTRRRSLRVRRKQIQRQPAAVDEDRRLQALVVGSLHDRLR